MHGKDNIELLPGEQCLEIMVRPGTVAVTPFALQSLLTQRKGLRAIAHQKNRNIACSVHHASHRLQRVADGPGLCGLGPSRQPSSTKWPSKLIRALCSKRGRRSWGSEAAEVEVL